MRFSLCIGDLEVRMNQRVHAREIVRWSGGKDGKACRVLALWEDSESGPELRFVGGRPFDQGVDTLVFWRLAAVGQAVFTLSHETLTDDD